MVEQVLQEANLLLGWGVWARLLLAVVVAHGAARVMTIALNRVSHRAVERRIAIKMLIPVFKTVIYAVAIYYIVGSVFQVSSSQLLAFSGLFGAALGFGIKDLFANVVGGIVMIVERPYRVGDKIQLGEHYGEVLDIGIRTTTLFTPDDSEVSVPNYLLFTEAMVNANAGSPEMLVVTEVAIDVEADQERAMEIMEQALITSPYVYVSDDRQPRVRVSDGPRQTMVRGKAYVNDHRNEQVFRSDVTERVLEQFDEEGIERPSFPDE